MIIFLSLFDSLGTADTYSFFVILIAAFLVGLLLSWLLQRRQVRQLAQDNAGLQSRFEEQERQVSEALRQLEERSVELGRLRGELEAEHQRLLRVEQEKKQLYTDIYAVNTELEKLQVSNQSYLSTIEDLNDQILGLKTRQQELAGAEREIEFEVSSQPANETPASGLTHRLDNLEQKMLQLENENISLKQELDDLKTQAMNYPGDQAEMEPMAELNLAAGALRLPTSAPVLHYTGQRDDLTLIRGVGPFLQKRLNEIGIYTFEQVSQWDEDQIDQVTEQLAYFEGRIEKDDWVAQARRLFELKVQDPAAFERLTADDHDPGDLTLIEGIGTVIENILKDNGIETWSELAAAVPEQLEEILENAGINSGLHDPSSWPVQAQLALNGDWDLLREYQERLHA